MRPVAALSMMALWVQQQRGGGGGVVMVVIGELSSEAKIATRCASPCSVLNRCDESAEADLLEKRVALSDQLLPNSAWTDTRNVSVGTDTVSETIRFCVSDNATRPLLTTQYSGLLTGPIRSYSL